MKQEAMIQAEILRYLRSLGTLCWVIKAAICNERGVPDLLCCYRGRFVAFEVKQPSGNLTKLQEATIQRIKDAKGKAYKVSSVEEVKSILANLEV